MLDGLPPVGHPIKSIEHARELLAGPLGREMRGVVTNCCVPLSCICDDTKQPIVFASGTITFVQTPTRLLGITAAHVIRYLECAIALLSARAYVWDVPIPDILGRRIDISDRLDLATLDFDQKLLARLSKKISPLQFWPPMPPTDGSGILLAGYPAKARLEKTDLGKRAMELSYGLFCSLGTARVVSDEQITWLFDPLKDEPTSDSETIERHYDYGGISGGPLIGCFETTSFVLHFKLSGIISQASVALENVVAKRADFIREDGSIVPVV